MGGEGEGGQKKKKAEKEIIRFPPFFLQIARVERRGEKRGEGYAYSGRRGGGKIFSLGHFYLLIPEKGRRGKAALCVFFRLGGGKKKGVKIGS